MSLPAAADRIKAKALQLGFAKVGIARAVRLAEEGEHLREWLSHGYDASMGWMRRRVDERIDISRVLPGARAVISFAMNYFTPFAHSDDVATGKVSRYAWGSDYHSVMGDRIHEFCVWMGQEFPDAASKWYVDTGPVMEKAWAQRAGVGWVGKHTNLIAQDLGSWVFLGEVITTLDLPPDPPATDHCGDCTLCIQACPTDAIVSPYVVDSNLCISYLTIEHRGGFSGGRVTQLEGWIYGCDVCQDVCPWNRKFACPTSEMAFQPREGHVSPELRRWDAMSKEEFEVEFSDTPIHRARYEGMKRNIELCRGKVSPPDSQP